MLDASGFLLGHEAQPPHSEGGWAALAPASAELNTSTSVPAPLTTTSGTDGFKNSQSLGQLSSEDLHRFTSFLENITSGPDEASPSTSSAFISPVDSNTGSTFSPVFTSSVDASPLFGSVSLNESFEPLFSTHSHDASVRVNEETKKTNDSEPHFHFSAASLAQSFDAVVAFPAITSGLSGPDSRADPAAFDAALESPLGLASSGSSDPSPLSDFLASPLFSVAGYESAVPSATMSELPLASPVDGYASSGLASGLPWFPPHPATSTTWSSLFGGGGGHDAPTSMAPPSSTGTILRAMPPAPPHPTPLLSGLGSTFSAAPHVNSPLAGPSTLPPVSPASAVAPTPTCAAKKAPNGFRPGELLPLTAPIQERKSLLPSATSRKRKTVGAERALAKRTRTSETPALEEAVAASPMLGDVDESDLPADIVAAVERKRLQNTLSARKSRARKQARLQELEAENDALKARIAELETRLGVYQR
ncbi:hypothetical protein BMF94_3131 [Rhodotorula taiwanensis]|uniref:BZIP domain-containing protein n=1 Tax=Rhodotorula taiwanensis TaxID=741276 RepID=A0A2S5BA00_9BASI|nr:hypothetical protein BMF94_3131 [Rhodotorula taiwanensis]